MDQLEKLSEAEESTTIYRRPDGTLMFNDGADCAVLRQNRRKRVINRVIAIGYLFLAVGVVALSILTVYRLCESGLPW